MERFVLNVESHLISSVELVIFVVQKTTKNVQNVTFETLLILIFTNGGETNER